MASPWHLYVAQLPRAYNILACWSDAERAELQVPHAVDAAARAAEEVRAARRRAAPALDALALPRAFRSERAWAWAHATVSSRTVFVPFDPAGALCPVGDLFNYAPPPPAHAPTFLGTPLEGGDEEETARVPDGGDDDASREPAGDGAWDEASGEYRFHARRAYRAGDQIMLCYGRYTNLELLEHYGFLLPPVPGNPNDVAEFPLIPARDAIPGTGTGSSPRLGFARFRTAAWSGVTCGTCACGDGRRRGARRATRDARGGESRTRVGRGGGGGGGVRRARRRRRRGAPRITHHRARGHREDAARARAQELGRRAIRRIVSREHDEPADGRRATEEIDRCLDPDGAPSEWTEEEGRDAEEAAARVARTAEDPDGNASLALRWRLAHKRARKPRIVRRRRGWRRRGGRRAKVEKAASGE